MSIESYLTKYIELLDNGSITVQDLTNAIISKMQGNGLTVTDELRSEIESSISRYKNNEITSSDLINYLTSKFNTDSYVPKTKSDNPKTTEPETSQDESTVVDVVVDEVLDLSEQLGNIADDVSDTTVTIPSSIEPYAPTIKSTVENDGKEKIIESFNDTKEVLLNLLQEVTDIDEEIVSSFNGNFDFNDIWALAYNKKTGSNLKVADINFFKQNKDCIINGNEVTFVKDGKTYKYNLTTKLLSVNGDSVKVGFFVPNNTSNYSTLNTFTYFVADSYDNPTAYPSSAIVVRFLKGDVQSTDSRGNHKFAKRGMVPEATKFINGVAKTDLSKCQNIIGGDSLYGAESLKIAASNGDLYKTVYCVNNAVLVTGKNATKGEKVQFGSIDELKGLEGKNIYFISATSDQNFDHCAKNGSGWASCNYNEGYVFTGIDLVAKNCPNANIFLVYSQKGKQAIKNHYSKVEKKYSNVYYLSDKWNYFVKKDYQTHTDGNRMMSELVSAQVTGYNAYHM